MMPLMSLLLPRRALAIDIMLFRCCHYYATMPLERAADTPFSIRRYATRHADDIIRCCCFHSLRPIFATLLLLSPLIIDTYFDDAYVTARCCHARLRHTPLFCHIIDISRLFTPLRLIIIDAFRYYAAAALFSLPPLMLYYYAFRHYVCLLRYDVRHFRFATLSFSLIIFADAIRH